MATIFWSRKYRLPVCNDLYGWMYTVVCGSGIQADLGETCELLLQPSSEKKKERKEKKRKKKRKEKERKEKKRKKEMNS